MPPQPTVAEWDADLVGGNPLAWDGYTPPREETVVTGRTATYAFVEGRFDVLGGSMGAVHGERVVRAYRRAIDERLPVVALTASGGARMQEGMVSLIQMARTASAAQAHAAAGLLSVAIHRHPTTGGVFASYGSLADVRAASPGATVGFAGPRVVELTTGEALPPTSHTAESAHAAGLVDALVAPNDEADWIHAVLGLRPLSPPNPFWADFHALSPRESAQNAWGEVQRARAEDRPTGTDVAWMLCESWVELRSGDPVVRAALATIGGVRVVVIAHDRRADLGRPCPAGMRLAQRAIALAGRLGLPVVTFIDTPGAEPGPAAEADGIAREIAATFAAMGALRSASVAVCVGEGGSGGALAFGHADRLLVLEHAVFSVIGPEGAAAILERDVAKAPAVAERLRLTSADLLGLGIVDGVVNEQRDAIAAAVADALTAATPGDRLRRTDAATARWIRK
ncbi:MAG TPA: carboxyl transferase domain-containing protein [Acidimicrobiales bacterium]|nr:carboxyl transferase domain-containing protein [Acidimicrobiales bacterium]